MEQVTWVSSSLVNSGRPSFRLKFGFLTYGKEQHRLLNSLIQNMDYVLLVWSLFSHVCYKILCVACLQNEVVFCMHLRHLI